MRTGKSIVFILLFCLLLSAYALPAEAEPVTPSGAETPEEAEPAQIERNGVFPLLEREDASLELIVARNPESAELGVYLHFSQSEGSHYLISDPVANGNLRLLQEGNVEKKPYGTETVWPLDVGPLLAQGLFSFEDFHSFRCHVMKYVWSEDGNHEIPLWEEDCELTIPENYRPDYVFMPFQGVWADSQILSDDGEVRVTLLGLGGTLWDSWSDGNPNNLYALFRVENRGEEALPFKVTGLSVNGSFVHFSGGGSYTLPPHTACYSYLTIYKSSLPDEEATRIHDLEFLLLTSKEENTGYVNRGGGTWAPVELSGSHDAADRPEITDPVFENDWIRIEIVDFTEISYFSDDRQGYCWRLLVENRSETDLELSCVYEGDYTTYYSLSEKELQAGGWRYIDLTLYGPKGSVRPELNILFEGKTLGGGSLLFLEEEPVLFSGEP